MARVAQHKENLIRTAMRLFRRQGYASTGLQQIVLESKAPKGSLYHYFPGGKEALGAAAVTMAGAMILEMLTELAARHEQPRAFLDAYCRTMAGWMEESAFRSGCPIATILLETAPESVAIREAGREAIDRWIEVIATVLLRDDPDALSAGRRAQAIVAAMEGALLLARVRESPDPILEVAWLA